MIWITDLLRDPIAASAVALLCALLAFAAALSGVSTAAVWALLVTCWLNLVWMAYAIFWGCVVRGRQSLAPGERRSR